MSSESDDKTRASWAVGPLPFLGGAIGGIKGRKRR